MAKRIVRPDDDVETTLHQMRYAAGRAIPEALLQWI